MSEEMRPDPEKLLRQIQQEEQKEKKKKRGKFSIFLGYAAGVGKTYAMLDAAHQAQKNGIDVVAGYIEPHARPETRAMMEGLEVLPPLMVEYKGIELREMDLDAVLKRRPQLALVDELAHTNAKGLRHQKRYEDIEEILDAGIDVYTTVNIQHLESLNDIVGSITGIHMKERVPDTVFDSADQVKIIDIEPETLIQRLQEGKIYKSIQAERALNNFFAKEKLISLREIALRRTADRVNRIAIEESKMYRDKKYYTGEHVLTCISPSPTCAKVIRSASRLAYAFHANFTALYVETPDLQNADRKVKKMVEENMHLAEALGAKIATVFGEDIPFQIAEYAKICSASKLVLGRTNHKIWLGQKKGTLTDQITQYIPNMDIYIIPDTSNRAERWAVPKDVAKHKKEEKNGSLFLDLIRGVATLGIATVVSLGVEQVGFMSANIIIIYLFAILMLSLYSRRRWVSAVAALLSVFLFNFFFVPPIYSFAVHAPAYYTTFVFMFLFAFIISTIITSERKQAKESAKFAYRTELLLENSKRMRRVHTVRALLKELSNQVLKLMNLSVIFFVKKDNKMTGPWLFPRVGMDKAQLRDMLDDQERAVIQWVLENKKRAGCCTHTLPGAQAMYLPIKSGDEIYAVMGIVLEEKREIPPFEYGLLTAMLNEAALVFARIYMTNNNVEEQKGDQKTVR